MSKILRTTLFKEDSSSKGFICDFTMPLKYFDEVINEMKIKISEVQSDDFYKKLEDEILVIIKSRLEEFAKSGANLDMETFMVFLIRLVTRFLVGYFNEVGKEVEGDIKDDEVWMAKIIDASLFKMIYAMFCVFDVDYGVKFNFSNSKTKEDA